MSNYLDNPVQDLEEYLTGKSVSKLTEDELEITGGYIYSYVVSILENKTWKEIVGGDEDLTQEIQESFDANEILYENSKNILYIDFLIKANEVIKAHSQIGENILSVISVFDLKESEKEKMNKNKITYEVIIKNKTL